MAGPWANESEGSPVPLVDSHIVNLHYLGELAGRNTVGFLVFFFEKSSIYGDIENQVEWLVVGSGGVLSSTCRPPLAFPAGLPLPAIDKP